METKTIVIFFLFTLNFFGCAKQRIHCNSNKQPDFGICEIHIKQLAITHYNCDIGFIPQNFVIKDSLLINKIYKKINMHVASKLEKERLSKIRVTTSDFYLVLFFKDKSNQRIDFYVNSKFCIGCNSKLKELLISENTNLCELTLLFKLGI